MLVKEIKQNQVVHCATHKESRRVCRLFHLEGKTLKSGYKYYQKDGFKTYGENVCYHVFSGVVSTKEKCETENLEIIPSTDITLDTDNQKLLLRDVKKAFNLMTYCKEVADICENYIILNKNKFDNEAIHIRREDIVRIFSECTEEQKKMFELIGLVKPS